MDPNAPASPPSSGSSSSAKELAANSDLARHFMECGALNANLTLAPGARMVITDDIFRGSITDLSAFSMAAVTARDSVVGQAALLPLGLMASRLSGKRREKFERLFSLIEESAFAPGVRGAVQGLINASSIEAEIRTLSRELGDVLQPARVRYRQFLDIVRAMIERRISRPLFLDEFTDFTYAVAGKLDFGIYALCLDRLFGNTHIPLTVKADILDQVMTYPPTIRKELLTNLMSSPSSPAELVTLAEQRLGRLLTRDQVTEIMLFTTLKLTWAAQRERAQRNAA